MRIVLFLNFLLLLNPVKNLNIYFNYGWATFLENIGEVEKARETLLKVGNKDFFYYIKLGELETIDYEKAIKYFKKAEEINGDNKRLLRDMGKVYFFKFMKEGRGEDLENAKKYLSLYLEKVPDDFLSTYFYGEALKYSGKYEEAVNILFKSYSLNTKVKAIFDEITLLKLKLKDYGWLLSNFKKINSNEIKGKVAASLLDTAINKKKKDLLKEIDLYSPIVESTVLGGNVELIEKGLRLWFKMGEHEKIAKFIEENRLIEKSLGIKRFYLFSLFYNKKYRKLLPLLKESLSNNEDLPFTDYFLARYYFVFGCYRASHFYLHRGELPSFINPEFLKIFSFDVDLSYFLETQNKEKLKELLNGKKDFSKFSDSLKLKIFKAALIVGKEEIINSFKDNSEEFRALFIINTDCDLKKLKNLMLSKKALIPFVFKTLLEFNKTEYVKRLILSLSPKVLKNSYRFFLYGRYYEKKNKITKSLYYFKKAIEEEPDNISYINYYVYYALTKNEKIKGIKKYIENLKKSESPAIQDTVGYFYYKEGDFKKAEKYFKKALEVLSEDVEIKLHLADLYFRTQNYREAKTTYESVLSKRSCPYKKFVKKQAYILSKLRKLKTLVKKVNSFQALYSAKIYVNKKISPFRIKLYYERDKRFILKLYRFPMTEFAELYKSGDNYVLLNKRKKLFYIGSFKEIMNFLIGLKTSEKEFLYYLGINYDYNLEYENKYIKVDSYNQGFPKKIQVKKGDFLLRIKLLKFKINQPKAYNPPRLDKYKEVFDMKECFNEQD